MGSLFTRTMTPGSRPRGERIAVALSRAVGDRRSGACRTVAGHRAVVDAPADLLRDCSCDRLRRRVIEVHGPARAVAL